MKKNITISGKLVLLLVAAIAGMVLLSIYSLNHTKNSMLEDRKAELAHIIQLGLGTLDHYHKMVKDGKLSEADAKKAAFAALRDLRFANNDYIFVFEQDGTNRVLGPAPQRENTSMAEGKDANGVYYVKELIKLAQNGGGYLDYQFPKAGATAPSPKLGYSKNFEPWQLMIGTGVYTDDLDEAFAQQRNRLSAVSFVITLIVCAGGWLISRSITKPLGIITGGMNRLAGGDKQIVVQFTEKTDEIGSLARALETFKENAIKVDHLQAEQKVQEQKAEEQRKKLLNDMATQFEQSVKGVVSTVSSAATEMQGSAKSLAGMAEVTMTQSSSVSGAAESAANSVQTVASAAEELNASIGEITKQTNESVLAVKVCVTEAEATATEMQNLSQAAEDIESVVNMIDGIAHQVNLLALNATIEAARAGEAGKGFAVVANEVKNLATKTGNATKEIAGKISNIQGQTKHAVESIARISHTIKKVNEISTVVASAAEEQGAATQEISRNIQKTSEDTSAVSQNIAGVRRTAEETGEASKQLLDTAGQLARESETLRSTVDQFIAHIRKS